MPENNIQNAQSAVDEWATKEVQELTKKVLKIIAESDVVLGARDKASEQVKYRETAAKIIRLMMSGNVNYQETTLYFQLMRQAIGIIENAVMGSLELSMDIALEGFWKKHPDNVTLQDMDQAMAEGAKVREARVKKEQEDLKTEADK